MCYSTLFNDHHLIGMPIPYINAVSFIFSYVLTNLSLNVPAMLLHQHTRPPPQPFVLMRKVSERIKKQRNREKAARNKTDSRHVFRY